MEQTTGPIPVVRVLFALYPGMDAMNVLGPLEVLDKALQEDGSKLTPVALTPLSLSPRPRFILVPPQLISTSCTYLAGACYHDYHYRLLPFLSLSQLIG